MIKGECIYQLVAMSINSSFNAHLRGTYFIKLKNLRHTVSFQHATVIKTNQSIRYSVSTLLKFVMFNLAGASNFSKSMFMRSVKFVNHFCG